MDSADPFLKETGHGLTIFFKGKHLYSTRNPRAGAVKIVAGTSLLPGTLVFIPSLGLGYGLPELLEKLPAESRVLCVECDQSLMRLAQSTPGCLIPQDPRLTVIRTDQMDPVRQFLEKLPPAQLRRVVSLPLCGAARLYQEFYDGIEDYLRTEIRNYWQNKMTLFHMGGLYVKNLFDNITLLSRVRNLTDLQVQKPLIVTGAGPSLSSVIPLLKEVKQKALLVTVDTALPVLLHSGIRPDFIFALEPQFINIQDFFSLGNETIPLIADLASSPQVLRFCLLTKQNPVYLFSSRFHPLSVFERLERQEILPAQIPPLGSVGVAAVYVALRITSGPVFIAGLDFSYPMFKTHARGAPFGDFELASGNRFCPTGQREYSFLLQRPRITLTDKQGNQTESDLVLSSYTQNLKTMSQQTGRIFDLDPLGLETGAPLLHDRDEVMRLIAQHPAAVQRKKGAQRSSFKAENVRAFLEAETKHIEEGLSLVYPLIAGEEAATGTLTGSSHEVLNTIEYGFFHLPAKAKLPQFTKAYLAQMVLALRYYRDRIGRTLTRLS
jgi:hypothetical protein